MSVSLRRAPNGIPHCAPHVTIAASTIVNVTYVIPIPYAIPDCHSACVVSWPFAAAACTALDWAVCSSLTALDSASHRDMAADICVSVTIATLVVAAAAHTFTFAMFVMSMVVVTAAGAAFDDAAGAAGVVLTGLFSTNSQVFTGSHASEEGEHPFNTLLPNLCGEPMESWAGFSPRTMSGRLDESELPPLVASPRSTSSQGFTGPYGTEALTLVSGIMPMSSTVAIFVVCTSFLAAVTGEVCSDVSIFAFCRALMLCQSAIMPPPCGSPGITHVSATVCSTFTLISTTSWGWHDMWVSGRINASLMLTLSIRVTIMDAPSAVRLIISRMSGMCICANTSTA